MTERHCWSRLSRALRMVLLAVACVTDSRISEQPATRSEIEAVFTTGMNSAGETRPRSG